MVETVTLLKLRIVIVTMMLREKFAKAYPRVQHLAK